MSNYVNYAEQHPWRVSPCQVDYIDEKGHKVTRPFGLNYTSRKDYPFGRKRKKSEKP